MNTSQDELRVEHRRLTDEVNRRREAKGKRLLRRHVLPLHVIEKGLTGLPWFEEVVVEIPRRGRWHVCAHKSGELVWLDAKAEHAYEMRERLGRDWR